MAKKNEAQVRFTADTSGFVSEVKKINAALQLNRAELKLASAELKGSADDVDLLQKQHNLLENAVEQSGNKVKALSEELKIAEGLLGKSSQEYQRLERAVLAAKTEQQNYVNALKQNEAAMKAVEDAAEQTAEEIEDLAENMDNAAESSLSFSDVLRADLASEAIVGGIKGIAGAISGVISECTELAMGGVKGMNNFAAQTGKTGEELDEFREIMHEIYTDNFGENLEEIAESMVEVERASGLTGDALKKTTEDAYSLQDAFGYDIPESMRAASSLVNQFGITYDDAMNLIAQGTQNGLNWSDELLDTINEYAPHFATAGLSAEEMFNVFANGAEAGAFNLDKIGDAMKEFGIRVIDGSDTTKEGFDLIGLSMDEMAGKYAKGGESAQEAFTQIIQKLSEVKDPLDQNAAGVALFGTMWEDLGADAVLAMGNINGSISTTTDALKGINNVQYNDLDSALEGIKRQLTDGVSQSLETRVLPALNDFANNADVSELADGIANFTGNLIDAGTWLVEHKELVMGLGIAVGGVATVYGIASTALGVYNTVTGLAAAGSALLASGVLAAAAPFALITAGIAGVVAVGVLLYKNWDTVKAKAGELKDTVVTKVTGLKDDAAAKFTAFKEEGLAKINGLKTSALGKFDEVKNGIKSKIDWAKDSVKLAVDKIKGFFDFKWSLPKPKIPKFSLTGKFSLSPPSVPKISIDWNAQGAFFTGPTVVPQGLGEAGKEYALPLNRITLRPLAEMITELQTGSTRANIVTFNINATVREEADIEKITDEVNYRLATILV